MNDNGRNTGDSATQAIGKSMLVSGVPGQLTGTGLY